MRRLLVLSVLLVVGCRGVVGPREHRGQPIRVDDPRLSIEEQKRLGRDRLALPVEDYRVGPPAIGDGFGPHGRGTNVISPGR